MNSFVTVACLLAVLGLSQGSAIGTYGGGYGYGLGGYGVPIVSSYIAPAAISTANVYKAAPIPIVKTIYAPVIKSVVPINYGYGLGLEKGLYGGYGLGGYGLGGYGLGGYGHGGYGLGGYGLGGYGLGKGLYGGYGIH